MSPEEIAVAYLAFLRGGKNDTEVFGTVLETCTSDLEHGMQLTLALVAASNNERELAYVAAGPVEDLLKSHGVRAIPALEAAADVSEKLRNALAGVWLGEQHEAFAEWKRLLAKYGRS